MAYGDMLPRHITPEDIKKMSPKEIRKLIRIYSPESVNMRLSGEDPVEEEQESTITNVLTATAVLFDREILEKRKKTK